MNPAVVVRGIGPTAWWLIVLNLALFSILALVYRGLRRLNAQWWIRHCGRCKLVQPVRITRATVNRYLMLPSDLSCPNCKGRSWWWRTKLVSGWELSKAGYFWWMVKQ